MSDATTNNDITVPDRWRISKEGIEWNVADDTRLPHSDHIELSGKHVSTIIRYRVDSDRRLTLSKEVIWPILRTKEGDVRGYLRRTFGPESEPVLLVGGETTSLGHVARVVITEGYLSIHYAVDDSLRVYRHIHASPDLPTIVDSLNVSGYDAERLKGAQWRPVHSDEHLGGVYGSYTVSVRTMPTTGQSRTVRVNCGAFIVEQQSDSVVRSSSMVTPGLSVGAGSIYTGDDILDTAFSFARYRSVDSLFETKMGLVHSPGGGRYYGGIWANDQAEYSGPLFGYLGHADAERAALTAYRNFMPYMTPEFTPIPSSLEMEGTIPFRGAGDRGDAAMYAGGAARYALSRGDRAVAEELYPAIQWCLEYCHRKTNTDGVVESDSDELEGRFPTGKANLSTSCLAYDGLRRGADLARALGHEDDGREYDQRADALEAAIEAYFGATVEGFHTYRYYDGNTTLRAWVCLPLCFGIGRDNPERVQGTLDALFSPRLWTPDGLATESGDTVFWDRSTLFALRGAFLAGDTDRAASYLSTYSRRRLLGEHVPYPVEAYPEGDQAHLSAESALYCRVLTEGLFGYVPTGLDSFSITPRLPSAWSLMTLIIPRGDALYHVNVTRPEPGAETEIEVRVSHDAVAGDRVIVKQKCIPGVPLSVTF